MKITNPNKSSVSVGHWVIAPNSSKAIHALTGQSVDQLPDSVASSLAVQGFVRREVLQSDVPLAPLEESSEEPTPVVRPTRRMVASTKKHRK
jgi:hypothetical protein